MDVILYAREQEDQAAQYYCELAALTCTQAVRDVLQMIGGAHTSHRNALDAIMQARFPTLGPRRILTDGAVYMHKMEQQGLFGSDAIDSLGLYRGIMEVELQMEQFYREERSHLDAPLYKDFFMKLAGEAHKHHSLMHSLCELLIRHDTLYDDIELQMLSG